MLVISFCIPYPKIKSGGIGYGKSDVACLNPIILVWRALIQGGRSLKLPLFMFYVLNLEGPS